MILLDGMRERCVLLQHVVTPDGQGGNTHAWSDGAAFDALIRKDMSAGEDVGQQRRLKERFTIAVDRTVALNCEDVFRRVRDGAIFRLTSSTKDGEAPEMSTVPIAKATCERWTLT